MSNNGIKILLVEDNDNDAEFMTEMLKRQAEQENLGITITRAKLLKEAYEKVNHNHVILADLLLPDSPDVLHTAVNLCLLKGPPVFAWSRTHDHSLIRACGRLGVRNYFWKDCEIPCLVAHILVAMGNAEAYAEMREKADKELANSLLKSEMNQLVDSLSTAGV